MANNYTPSYNQYLTHTAGYALPSSVRTYSVFDPSSNSWRRMTNDGRSPMQQGTQADIQAALRYADSSQGKVWDNPAQAPAQTPLGGPRTPSQPLPRGGTVIVQGQPANDPVAEAMSLRGLSTDASGVSLNPNLNYAFRSGYENFQREIPRSNAYGPLQNPKTVRNMSPDYQEASATPATAAPAQAVTPVTVQLAPSHKPTVSVYDIIQQEHDRIPERIHQIGLNGPIGGIATGLNKTLLPMLKSGFLKSGLGSTIEPLSKVTHAARTATTGSRLTPQAQKIADSLKFTFSH